MTQKFRCGDIFGLPTNKTTSGRLAYKYHLCVCISPDLGFLLINTTGSRKGAMTISPDEWSEMTAESSFIGCQNLLRGYSKTQLANAKPKGRLSDAALQRLLNHIGISEVMEGHDIDLVVDAIMSHLEN